MSTAAGEPVIATFRPAHGDIALSVAGPGGQADCLLGLDEGQALHEALGRAIRIAGCVGRPLDALDPPVPEESSPVREAIRAIVADQVNATYCCGDGDYSPIASFAQRIRRGQAEDSEPMRIGIAVACELGRLLAGEEAR